MTSPSSSTSTSTNGGNDTSILTASYYQQSRGYSLAACHRCDLARGLTCGVGGGRSSVAMGVKVVVDVETVEAVPSSGLV